MKNIIALSFALALCAEATDNQTEGGTTGAGPKQQQKPKDVVPPRPKRDESGDKNPKLFEWVCKHGTNAERSAYIGRKLCGTLITETVIKHVAKSGIDAIKRAEPEPAPEEQDAGSGDAE